MVLLPNEGTTVGIKSYFFSLSIMVIDRPIIEFQP